MAKINLTVENLFKWKKSTFLPLGKRVDQLNNSQIQDFEAKLNERSHFKPEAIWGTLGWANEDLFLPKGQLEFSESGNLDSQGLTLSEVKNIWDFNPLSSEPEFIVKERYINFDACDFNFKTKNFSMEEIPAMRLCLFLNPDEGAIVFYQHSKRGEENPEEGDVEYILPQQTDPNYSTNRDRLNYKIPIIPREIMEFNDETGLLSLKKSKIETGFVIKILTFKRHNLAASELLNEANNNINLWVNKEYKQDVDRTKDQIFSGLNVLNHKYNFIGKSKYSVLKYDLETDNFYKISKEEIDGSKKTLLLLHGTFSNTHGSYGKLYNNENSLLSRLIRHGLFEQILSFDHPTITHDAFDNCQVLYERLAGLVFEKNIDILSYSRGALVAKWLASDPNNTYFNVDHIITFSGANGVSYYKSGNYVSKGLSILRKLFPGPTAKLIAAFAQFSAEFFLQLPGNQQMTPNHLKLVKILTSPLSRKETRVQTVVANWDKSLSKNSFKRPFASVLDAMIKFILGPKHDWVVGFPEQKIRPDPLDHPIEIASMHVKNFNLDYVKTNTHDIIYNYFKLKR